MNAALVVYLLKNHRAQNSRGEHRAIGETDEIDEPKQIGRQAGRATSSEWRAEKKPVILATA
jgi:hypothetical protein